MEAAQSLDALESVDDDVAMTVLVGRDDHDRNQLPHIGDGRNESLQASRALDPETVIAEIQLFDFAFHRTDVSHSGSEALDAGRFMAAATLRSGRARDMGSMPALPSRWVLPSLDVESRSLFLVGKIRTVRGPAPWEPSGDSRESAEATQETTATIPEVSATHWCAENCDGTRSPEDPPVAGIAAVGIAIY